MNQKSEDRVCPTDRMIEDHGPDNFILGIRARIIGHWPRFSTSESGRRITWNSDLDLLPIQTDSVILSGPMMASNPINWNYSTGLESD